MILCYWDQKAARQRIVTGYIGEGGLKANVPYRLDDKGRFKQVRARRQGKR